MSKIKMNVVFLSRAVRTDIAEAFLLFCFLLFFVSGCVPGAGNMQGSALPFMRDGWPAPSSAEYLVSQKKNPSGTRRLIISYAPSGKDKVLITMVLKEMNDLKKDGEKRADLEAYLDKNSLQPVEVNKSLTRDRARLEIKTQYQGARVAVQLLKNKKKKNLSFDSPSKVYYDNDVFLLVLQALDFDAYLKKQSETKHGTLSVALAHPQLGHVPVASLSVAKKRENVPVSGKTISCYRVEISYGKKVAHRAWYKSEAPHTLLQVETRDERFVLKEGRKESLR